MKNNSSKILKALRKYFEMTQVDFCALIGVSQSALSKIEAGLLELSAFQWVTICEKFNVAPKSLFTGKIEQLGNTKIALTNLSSVGGFTIPKKYSHLQGSTVRSAYPLVQYMYETLGETKAIAFLKSVGFDIEYFVIMSNPLNLLFTQDLVEFLISQNVLSPADIPSIIKTTKFENVHSSIISELSHAQNLASATKKLLQKVKISYEVNTHYEWIGDKDFVIATDHDHVAEFKLKSEFNMYRQLYNLSHFESLNQFVGGAHSLPGFQLKPADTGWMIIQAS